MSVGRVVPKSFPVPCMVRLGNHWGVLPQAQYERTFPQSGALERSCVGGQRSVSRVWHGCTGLTGFPTVDPHLCGLCPKRVHRKGSSLTLVGDDAYGCHFHDVVPVLFDFRVWSPFADDPVSVAIDMLPVLAGLGAKKVNSNVPPDTPLAVS